MSGEEIVREVATSKILELGGFLVHLKVHPNQKVILEFDKPEGVNISDCAAISRALENDTRLLTFFESHGLEVSSPGMESPFRVMEQYKKNVGRKVKVKLNEEGETSGKLLSVNEEGIELEPFAEKNKTEVKSRFIPFVNIKETRKIVNFKSKF